MIKFLLVLLMYEDHGLGLEVEGDSEEEDHPEGREHLCYSVTQQDVHPRDLLGQVALDTRSRVRHHIHDTSHANMQEYYHFHAEYVALVFLSDLIHAGLDHHVQAVHKDILKDQIAKIEDG